MGFFDTEVSPAMAAASTYTNAAMKWAIISGLIGVLGVTGVMVGLHLTGNLTPDKGHGVKDALVGGHLSPQSLDSTSNLIRTGFIASIDPVRDAVSDTLGSIKDALPELDGGIDDALSDAGDNMKDVLSDAGHDVKDVLSDIADGLGSDVVNDAKDALSDPDDVFDAELDGEDGNDDLQEIIAALGDAADDGEGVLEDATEAVADAADEADLVESVDIDLVELGDALDEAEIKGVFNDAAETLFSGANDAAEKLTTAVKEGAERVGDGAKEVVSKAGEAAGDALKKFADVLRKSAGQAAEGLKDAAGSVSDGLGNMTSGRYDADKLNRLGFMMMASVLGEDFNRPRPVVNSAANSNVYSSMSIARPPAHLPTSVQQQVQNNMGALLLTMSGFLDLDIPDLGGELDLDFEFR
ncbi:hypothetical protein Btru_049482 [Bulinus truncatus]|nr:hypothetical protein Btru_049482 [Bulinus truncatus]